MVCMHIGSSSSMTVTSIDAPVDVSIAITPMNSFLALNDLMWTPICRKFPNIMIAMSEGGTGWIPYALERMDYTYWHHKAWTGADFGGLTPTEIFHRNFSTCFIDDNAGIEMRHKVGIDRMTWECDYPHSDSTWPHSADLLAHSLEGVPDDEIDKITHLNAMRISSSTRSRSGRARSARSARSRPEAADVDVSIRSLGPGTRAASWPRSSARSRAARSTQGRETARRGCKTALQVGLDGSVNVERVGGSIVAGSAVTPTSRGPPADQRVGKTAVRARSREARGRVIA